MSRGGRKLDLFVELDTEASFLLPSNDEYTFWAIHETLYHKCVNWRGASR